MKSLILATALLAIAAPAAAQQGEAMLGVRHVGITVSDIDETVAFYGATVPFEVVRRERVPARAFPRAALSGRTGEVDVALIRTPTVFLQLMDFDPGSPSPPLELPVNGPGYTHVCWQAPTSAPVWSRLVESGLKFVTRGGAPVDLGGYGVTYAYGRDRDGTMIEMETMDRPVRADRAWATHVAVVTPDLDRMVAFYQTVLGQPPRRRAGPVSGARFDAIADIDGLSLSGGWFTLRNFEIEMWQYHSPATPVPAGDRPIDHMGHSLIAFEVADLAAATRRLRAADVRLVGRPVRMMGWRIQYARDPDGNLIAVQQRAGAGAEESVVPLHYLDPAAGPMRRT